VRPSQRSHLVHTLPSLAVSLAHARTAGTIWKPWLMSTSFRLTTLPLTSTNIRHWHRQCGGMSKETPTPTELQIPATITTLPLSPWSMVFRQTMVFEYTVLHKYLCIYFCPNAVSPGPKVRRLLNRRPTFGHGDTFVSRSESRTSTWRNYTSDSLISVNNNSSPDGDT